MIHHDDTTRKIRDKVIVIALICAAIYTGYSSASLADAYAQDVPAPWRLDIDFGALSTDCAEEPKATQIGDGWIRVDFVDDEGNSGTAYTKGTVLVYASPIEESE